MNLTDVLVGGDGPIPAEGMLVGQGPGVDEAKMLVEFDLPPRPFVGMAGQELDEYLVQANIPRQQLYITNCYKHFIVGNLVPSWEQLSSHRDILLEEISIVHPCVVGSIGSCSSQWISELGGDGYFRDMESEHGRPRWVTVGGHRFILIPLYHPAAGLYNPEMMGNIWYDFQVYGRVLRGEITPPDTPPVEPSWGTVQHIEGLRNIFCDHKPIRITIDTESADGVIWGLTFSVDGYWGWRIAMDRVDLLEEFQRLIHHYSLTVILQNSVHDIPVLREMGVETTDLPLIDTMILAYLLCVEPQGLKALGWRWMRVAMNDYKSIADPATERKARKYLEAAEKIDWDKCPQCKPEFGPVGVVGKKHLLGGANPSFMLTPKGNVRKQYKDAVLWCPGGDKCTSGGPLNKKIHDLLHPAEKPAVVTNDDDDIPF